MKSYLHEKVRPVRTLIFPVVYHSFVTVETGFCQPQIFFHTEEICSAWAVEVVCSLSARKYKKEQVLELLFP